VTPSVGIDLWNLRAHPHCLGPLARHTDALVFYAAYSTPFAPEQSNPPQVPHPTPPALDPLTRACRQARREEGRCPFKPAELTAEPGEGAPEFGVKRVYHGFCWLAHQLPQVLRGGSPSSSPVLIGKKPSGGSDPP